MMWDAMEQHRKDVDGYIKSLKDELDRLRDALRREIEWIRSQPSITRYDMEKRLNALLEDKPNAT